jgi:geranylgeranyl diphosphate synthase, type III
VNCVQNHPEIRTAIVSILRQRTNDVDVKKYAISLLKDCGALEYTRHYLVELEIKALDLIQELGGNDILTFMILNLSSAYKSQVY